MKFLQIFKIKDLRKKILIVAFLLLCFRILAAVPIPDINAEKLNEFFSNNQLFGMLSLFTGGTLQNLSIVMLGVGPYITAIIIMQLLTLIFPRLKQLYYEEGAAGRAKFNRYSRYLTVPLAAFQGYGFLNFLIYQNVIPPMDLFELLKNVILITAGTMVLVWLGELISEQKIGNGISIIIFAGIIAQLPQIIRNLILNYKPEVLPTYIAFLIISVFVIAGVVFIQEGERKIPVSYAKRVRGMRMYGGVSSYLPVKVNQAGVIPIIFAIAVLFFPQVFAQIISTFSPDLSLTLNEWVTRFFNNIYLYSLAYFLLVVAFTYFYTAITFEPYEIAKNLQKMGGFIMGIRPGEATASMLSKVVNRLTLTGAIFLGLIAILPNMVQMITGIQALTIGGTALLIVVAVALEVMKQINSQLTLREYETL